MLNSGGTVEVGQEVINQPPRDPRMNPAARSLLNPPERIRMLFLHMADQTRCWQASHLLVGLSAPHICKNLFQD